MDQKTITFFSFLIIFTCYGQESKTTVSIRDPIIIGSIYPNKICIVTGDEKRLSDENIQVLDFNGKKTFEMKKGFVKNVALLSSLNTMIVITEGSEPTSVHMKPDSIFVIDLINGATKKVFTSNAANYLLSPNEKYLMTDGIAIDRPSPLQIINLNTGQITKMPLKHSSYSTCWVDEEHIAVALYQEKENPLFEKNPKEITELKDKKREIEAKIIARHQLLASKGLDKKKISMDSLIIFYSHEAEKLFLESRKLEKEKYNKNPVVSEVGKLILYNIVNDRIIVSKEIRNRDGSPVLLKGSYYGFKLFRPMGHYIYLHNGDKIYKFDTKFNLIWSAEGIYNQSEISIVNDKLIYIGNSKDSTVKEFDETGRLIPLNSNEVQINSRFKFDSNTIRHLYNFKSDKFKINIINDLKKIIFQK